MRWLLRQLSQKQLLLRGAFLRNTEWVVGFVIYTGQDTKIMRNSQPGMIKSSSIQDKMNGLILIILFVQLSACIISAVLAAWWMKTRGVNHWYVWQSDWNPDIQAVLVFFGYFLLYNTMIPISLIVSLEFVKLFQTYFINFDEDMYVKQRDRYAKAQTSTINEDLG